MKKAGGDQSLQINTRILKCTSVLNLKKSHTTTQSYHALVVCSHFLGIISMKHAPRFILFVASVTKATALATITRAGPERWPIPLEHMEQHSKKAATCSEQTIQVNFTDYIREQTCDLTWEELSSSATCDEVERESSDWPRDLTLPLPFSNRPLPLLCGGDESESLATPPSSSVELEWITLNTFHGTIATIRITEGT